MFAGVSIFGEIKTKTAFGMIGLLENLVAYSPPELWPCATYVFNTILLLAISIIYNLFCFADWLKSQMVK